MTEQIWAEPVRGAHYPAGLVGLSGIEQLRLFLTGRAPRPPISYLTGMRPTEFGAGTATFVMPITDWLRTPQGVVSVGEVAVLADGPLGCAIQTVLPPATAYTTTDLSINMVRSVPARGQLIARGRLIQVGRSLGLSEAFVTDDAGRLVAHATSRCAIFPPLPDAPPVPAEIDPVDEDEPGYVPPFERPAPGTVLDQQTWAERSGLDVMRAHLAGELPAPPISHLIGALPTDAGEGWCQFTLPATGWLTSPTGFVQGGVTACLADFALAGAVQTTVPAGTAYAPTELRVQFVRPVTPDGKPLTARAQVVHRGRSVAASRGEVTNEAGKLVALASASALILPGRRADLAGDPSLS